MRSGHLHPAWRAFRRNQRILAVALPFPLMFLALFAASLSERVIIAVLLTWLLAVSVPFLLVVGFRCPSCQQPWQLNAFSQRCRSCGLRLWEDPEASKPPPGKVKG